MPTYDYRCEFCQHQFEVSQKITDQPLISCPACDQEGLKRGIGGGSATFRFVGEGFYITDYKTKPKEGSSPSCKGSCT